MGYDVDSNISTPSGEHTVEYTEGSYYDDVLPATFFGSTVSVAGR